MIPKFLTWIIGRMELPLTEMGMTMEKTVFRSLGKITARLCAFENGSIESKNTEERGRRMTRVTSLGK